jgi:hypothetical protein
LVCRRNRERGDGKELVSTQAPLSGEDVADDEGSISQRDEVDGLGGEAKGSRSADDVNLLLSIPGGVTERGADKFEDGSLIDWGRRADHHVLGHDWEGCRLPHPMRQISGQQPPSSRRSGSPVVVVRLARDMELDAVEQGVIVDRTRVCSAATKGLEVVLSGPSKVLVGDRREREQLDVVDLDRHRSAPVDAADLDLRPRPQAVRDSDGSVRHPIAKARTELHRAILSPATRRATGDRVQIRR